jgi:hypothetical protein
VRADRDEDCVEPAGTLLFEQVVHRVVEDDLDTQV